MDHRLRRAVCVATLVAQWVCVSAHAQIVASPHAPPDQRPQVTTAPNGVPLVHIQAPSAAGVSRNVYSQFDVQARGTILNNSAGDTRTSSSSRDAKILLSWHSAWRSAWVLRKWLKFRKTR